MAETLFLGSWIPHPNINEGQGVNENFEEVGGGISLKRAPVMFQVPLPPRENLSLWKSQTWEAKRTMTEHLEARGRAWGALLPQSSRCGFCSKKQAWGCLGSYPIELPRRMQRPQYRRSGGVQPDAQGLRRISSKHPEECFFQGQGNCRSKGPAGSPPWYNHLSVLSLLARPGLMYQAQGILPWAKGERVPYFSRTWTWTCLTPILVC